MPARRRGAPDLHVGEHITVQPPYPATPTTTASRARAARPLATNRSTNRSTKRATDFANSAAHHLAHALRRASPAAAGLLLAATVGCAAAASSASPRTNGTVLAAPGPISLNPAVPLPAQHRRWIDSTLAALSLRERVAQMVMVWVLGDFTNAREPRFLKIVEQVQRDGVGGVVMSLGSPIEVAAKLNYLQARAKVPLLVGSDVEPGLGRLEGGFFSAAYPSAGSATVLPSNMAIGATGRVEDAETAGRITGTEAMAIGIHMAFAPVVDVNNNPNNPVINIRSFGEDPRLVAQMAAAFVRGLQSTGAAATAKHFPGHGDTDTDSHLGLPVIPVQRARLDSVELLPFAAAIAGGVSGMMTAHIALPNAYGDSVPATLSARIMQNLLRDSLAFRGVTVTDAMTMDGLSKGYGVEESSVRAVEAGNDILLMPPDVTRAIDAVVRAVESGRLASSRIDVSVRRILELKLRTGAVSRPIVSLDALRDAVATPAHLASANAIAQRAITLLRDSASLVPVTRTSSVMILTYAADAEMVAGTAFTSEVRAQGVRVRHVRLSPHANDVELDSLVRDTDRVDRVIVYTYTRTLEGEGRLAIPSQIAAFIGKLAVSGKLIVVAGGNPYQVRQVSQIPTYMVTFGRGEALERAAARALFGSAPISGHSPVSLPGYFSRGDGIMREARGTP